MASHEAINGSDNLYTILELRRIHGTRRRKTSITALTALIAQMENPTPIAEPDYSVPVKDTFVQAIAMAKQAQAQPDIDKKVAG